MKIFLIGFMGSGKTTLGKKLAHRLNLEFIDLDLVISENAGQSVREIFETRGEDFFRDAERDALISLVTKDSFVMAVGGGTPCFFNNMELMNLHGLTLYLKLTPEALRSRLEGKTHHRPLLKGCNDESLLAYIRENLEKREKWYLQSAIIINEPEHDSEIIFDRIANYNPGSGPA